MAYYVGDIPAEALVMEPARNSEPIDLALFDIAEATLRDDLGAIVDTLGFTATIDAEVGQLVVEWPDQTPFTFAGLYSLHLVLSHTIEAYTERLAPVWLVVQADDGWHTIDTSRQAWPGAPDQDSWLHALLVAARVQVTAYAPTLTDGAWAPMNYRQGQLMQARNLWNASKVDPASGGLGEDTFMVRPFPLDWMVRQILRPKRAVPRIG